jgi:hypothetical protein
MFNNPLIQRYRFSLFQPVQTWIYAIIYVSTVVLIIMINSAIYKYQSTFTTPMDMYESLYYQFLVLQILVLWIGTAYNAGTTIPKEVIEKTYDFFRLLPLPAYKKTAGILIGKNLVALLLAAANFVFLFFFGFAGQINLYLQFQILLVLLAVAFFACSTSLLLSINPAKKKNDSVLVVLIILGLLVIPYIIGMVIQTSQTKDLEKITAWFYNAQIPILLVIAAVAFYFGCWSVIGILRRFTFEQKPLFSRKGAFTFVICYYLILLGLYYHYLPPADHYNTYSYWLLSLLPAFMVSFASCRRLDAYLEYSRAIQKKSRSESDRLTQLLLYSNPLLSLGLFAVWAVSALAVTAFTETSMSLSIFYVFVLFTYFLFLLLLLELHTLFNPVSAKIGYLLAFIAALYIILPLILSAIFESSLISLYSPFGFIASMFDDSASLLSYSGVWLVNILLIVIELLIIFAQYKRILKFRLRMQLDLSPTSDKTPGPGE